jgi:hypothetical protein
MIYINLPVHIELLNILALTIIFEQGLTAARLIEVQEGKKAGQGLSIPL